MKRPLKSWRDFLAMSGETRYSRRQRRALDDPEYKAHLDAVRRLPSAVKEAWQLYLNDENREVYPYGFAFHFPLQWRWMELEASTVEGEPTLSQRALKAADLGPDTVRAPDGKVDRWPSGRPMGTDSPCPDQGAFDFMGSPVGSDSALWRGDDGRLYLVDRLTGEILSEVDETEPPF